MREFHFAHESKCRNNTHLNNTYCTYSKIHLLFTNTLSGKRAALELMLKVQIICPVEQVNHDKREGKGDSGVVVYVVGVLHGTACKGAEHFADRGQSSEAPVGGLRGGRLGLWLAARGAGRANNEF